MGKKDKKEKTSAEIALKETGKKWKNTGITVSKCNLWLSGEQNKLQKALPSIVVSEENIVLTEEILAGAKKTVKAMGEARLGLTRSMDDVKKQLMQPEKDCLVLIDELASKLLTVKKEVKKEQDQLNMKAEQTNALKLAIKTAYDKYFAECQRTIDNELTNSYAVMLEAKAPLEKYDGLAKESVDGLVFPSLKEYVQRERTNTTALTDDEIKQIKKDSVQKSPDYKALLEQKFIDKKVTYQVELNNVAEALKQNELAAAEAKKKREHEATGKELANKIEAVAANQTASVPAVESGKKIKESFELDMEETPENALLIWACFSANFEAVIGKLTIKKWFSATPKQIGTALGKIKSDDNEFNFTGITFKKVEKLS